MSEPAGNTAPSASVSIEALSDDALYRACGVRIAFTGRNGGCSRPPFDSLNLGLHVDDEPEAVAENRLRLMSCMHASGCKLLVPNQVHGTRVLVVDGESDLDELDELAREGCDGLVVSRTSTAALLCFADCMPIVLAAPDASFAVVHAGWRGAYGHIAAIALEALCRAASCAPDCCNAYLGPCIRSECFEVSRDLAADFAAEFGPRCVSGPRHVDLVAAVKSDLTAAGADERRIADAGACTVCNRNDYFSHRASGGRCGRHGAFAVRLSE